METLREIGSSVAKLRSLLTETKKDLQRIQTLQDSLAAVLEPLWTSEDVSKIVESPPLWREFLSLVASGKVLSVSAEADLALDKAQVLKRKSWVGEGRAYVWWLGRGVVQLVDGSSEEGVQAAAGLCGRSFSLGYKDELVEAILEGEVLGPSLRIEQLQSLLGRLARHEQRFFLISTLNHLSKHHLKQQGSFEISNAKNKDRLKAISGSIALLDVLVTTPDTNMNESLTDWLLKSSSSSLEMLRAVIGVLKDKGREKVLESSWEMFGDELSIKHTPIMRQETITQVLLLTCGYVHRSNASLISRLARSSLQTKGISQRLGASSQKARFLGMVVGNTVSSLIDKPESRMTFEFDESDSEEARWYQNLVNVNDQKGSLEDLRSIDSEIVKKPNGAESVTKSNGESIKVVTKTPARSKVMVIEEIESDEDDLIPYAKPDSDPEDDTDDATLLDRDKPKVPVYIRDLISYLQDTSNYDRYRLGLVTAPSLIRRKADFGSEVKDRAEELAQIYAGLSDPFEFEDFHELRLQGLIAVLVAQPRQMGPWYARTFFTGDYSMGQRVGVLTAMGLGARELAGYREESDSASKRRDFPSKTLPERLHKIYADSTEILAISNQMSQSMLSPVTTKHRRKIIKNDLARLVAESFFFPLTGRWAAYGQPSVNHLSTHLLPHYLRTLALLLSFSGNASTALPQMTTEFWDLLLSLRSIALKDAAALEAMLFSFLTILNVNDDKRNIATEHSRELLETHEWVHGIFEKLNDVTSRISEHATENEEQKCKTLAAGVLVATKEVVDAHHRLMLGDMVDM